MSLQSVEEETNAYFHAELEARFDNGEMIEEFLKLIKERLYKGDKQTIEYVIEVLGENVSLDEAKDELILSYREGDYDYD